MAAGFKCSLKQCEFKQLGEVKGHTYRNSTKWGDKYKYSSNVSFLILKKVEQQKKKND